MEYSRPQPEGAAITPPPAALVTYLRTRMVWGLETWQEEPQNVIPAAASKEVAATIIVDFLVNNYVTSAGTEICAVDGSDPTLKQRNKRLMDYGLTFAKAIRANPGRMVDFAVGDVSVVLSAVINSYQKHIERNKAVYLNINSHHENLGKRSWAVAVQDGDSLQTYADAAKAMGEKQWVREGNAWMENFSLSFFRRNGARKHFMKFKKPVDKSCNSSSAVGVMGGDGVEVIGDSWSAYTASLPRDLMLPETFHGHIGEIRSSNTSSSGSNSGIDSTSGSGVSMEPRRIRLVDVGSCYNPIGKSDAAAAFDVTALDLCPTDPSVLQCDFLALEIGPEGSAPVIEYPAESEAAVSVSPRLRCLPAASFDVVTMSLVLNYLPTPTQREDMVRKARQLLIPPGHAGQPHRAGLLLLIEKESIFSYDLQTQQVTYNWTTNNGTLLHCWKQAIADCGFELVKYRNLVTATPTHETRRCHAFAFQTADIPSEPQQAQQAAADSTDVGLSSSSSSSSSSSTGGVGPTARPRLWIRQDFVSNPAFGETTDNKKVAAVSAAVVAARRPHLKDVDSSAAASTSSSGVSSDQNTTSNNDARRLPVAIVGGGLGGTALALALQRKGLPVAVFEKDSSFAARRQGYALTLQQATSSLRILDLQDGFRARGVTSLAHESYAADGTLLGAYGAAAREVGSDSGSADDSADEQEDFSSDNDDAGILVQPPSKRSKTETAGAGKGKSRGRHNVHIPRQALRELLMEPLLSGSGSGSGNGSSSGSGSGSGSGSCVHWNKQFVRYEECPGPGPDDSGSAEDSEAGHEPAHVKLHFVDGSMVKAAVLVAADGIYRCLHCLFLLSLSLNPVYAQCMLVRSLFSSFVSLCSHIITHFLLLSLQSPCLVSSRLVSSRLVHHVISAVRKQLLLPHTVEEKATSDSSSTSDVVIASEGQRLHGLSYLGFMVILGISPVVLGDGALITPGTYAHQNDKEARETGQAEGGGPVVSRRQTQWLDGRARVFTMPFDRGSTMWQLSFPLTEEEALALSGHPDRLKEQALAVCGGWHAPLVRLLRATELHMMSGHPAYDRDPLRSSADCHPPQYHRSLASPGDGGGGGSGSGSGASSLVTLIGDAAHPMSPFKAQGANQALLDALALCKALLSSDFTRPGRRPLVEALREYEDEMCARSAVKVIKSRNAAVQLHSPAALAVGNVTRAFAAEGLNNHTNA